MKLKHLTIFFILIFWPLGLTLHNQSSELMTFVGPVILLALTYRYYKNACWYYVLPLVLIPLISPKLTFFPLLFLAIQIVSHFEKNSKYHMSFPRKWESVVKWISNLTGHDKKTDAYNHHFRMFMIVSLAVSVLLVVTNWQQFRGQTVFTPDYEAQQLVIRNQQLYPTPLTARIFHNKFRIVGDKVVNNFFELTDPNNYFFGFAPRQVVGNQNLQKFPFLAIVPFILGIYYLSQSRDKQFIVLATTASLINLSFLTSYDKNDFILFIPLALVTIQGFDNFQKLYIQKAKWYSVIFIIFSTIEFLRLLLTK